MRYLIIPLRSRTASFRDPEFQNFHRSLPLPPPATCIGLAGAALGLPPAAAQAYFTEGEWQLGVAGTSAGVAMDFWKYNDFKTGSVLIREILYDNRFVIVFGHADSAKLEALANAFRFPVFALSCGNSDALCHVHVFGIRLVDGVTEASELAGCYVDGDVVAEALSAATADTTTEFSIRTTSLPVAQDLPVRFEYGKNGARMLRQRRLISYARYPIKLPHPVPGIKLSDDASSPGRAPAFVPVFPL